MRRMRSARLGGLSVVIVLVVTTASMTMISGTAGASSTVTCGQFIGNIPQGFATLKHCNDKANTGGHGTLSVGGNLLGSAWRIDWGNGTGSTFAKVTVTQTGGPGQPPDEPETYACPRGTSEYEINGTVTDFTGTASSIPIGDTVQAEVCLDPDTGTYRDEPLRTKFRV